MDLPSSCVFMTGIRFSPFLKAKACNLEGLQDDETIMINFADDANPEENGSVAGPWLMSDGWGQGKEE